MKVKDLIEHLRNIDPEYRVVFNLDKSEDDYELDEVETDYNSEILRIWIK